MPDLKEIRGITAFTVDLMRGEAESKQSENEQLREQIKLAQEASERTKSRFLNSLALAEQIRRECEREKGTCTLLHVCRLVLFESAGF